MGFFLFASGAALTLSAPTGWGAVSFREYPIWAVREDLSAATLVELTVDPNGQQVKCEVLSVVGDKRLSRESCNILGRKRLAPATFRDGTPAYGIVRTIFRLFIPGSKQGDEVAVARQRPDIEMSVNKLPDAKAVADAQVVVAVNEQGAVTDCGAGREETQTQLVGAVCSGRNQLGSGKRTTPDGHPIAYVTPMLVRLSTLNAPSR